MRFLHSNAWVILLLSMLVLSGCGGDPIAGAFKEMNKLKMSKLVNSYVMFASVNGGNGPKNEEELKSFIRDDERVAPRLGLSSGDLGDLDAWFISDADGEPFTIRYGLKIRVDEDRSPLIFDKTGVDGMRRIALADNEILEVTDDKKYERLLSGKMSSDESGPDKSEIAAGEDEASELE